jgi:hypothetical protein
LRHPFFEMSTLNVSTAIDGADVTGSADDRRSGTLHSRSLATAEEDEVEVTRHRLMEALDLLGPAKRGTVVWEPGHTP